jgi:EAL domain-containing protein (putative c-di-GMP-specific phosphodiesterase class I)/tetratricopeptide (TPR) repeat protein
MGLISVFASLVLLASQGAITVDDRAADEAYEARIQDARASMMADPQAALNAALAAYQAAGSPQSAAYRERTARARWLEAESLMRLGRPAEAAVALEYAVEALAVDAAPSQLRGDILMSRARIAMLQPDFEAALAAFVAARDMFQLLDSPRSEAMALQGLGWIYTEARQYDEALNFYSRAMDRHRDSSLDLAALNNRANVYRQLNQFEDALSDYHAALDVALALNSPILNVRILSNISALHVLRGDLEEADHALERAREQAPDLADSDWSRTMSGVEAMIASGRGDLRGARAALEQTFAGLNLDATPQPYLEFHELASEVFDRLGEPAAALAHLQAFKRLDDQARDIAASANSAVVAAEYNFAEQNFQLQQLRTERLEQDVRTAAIAERARLTTFSGILALIVGLLILAYSRYRVERARKLALKDALYNDRDTRLPTSEALVHQVRQDKEAGRSTYALAIKVHRYGQLQSALGTVPAAGLLPILSERLWAHYRRDQIGVIAPGTLCVILDGGHGGAVDHQTLNADIARIKNLLSDAVEVAGIVIDIHLTFGAAANTEGTLSVGDFRHALAAATKAEQERRLFGIHDPVGQHASLQNLTILSRLGSSLSSGDIKLHYQPKLNLHTGRFDSAEALMRWNDPSHGYISPDVYIPLCEETGQIRKLTEWSLKQALNDQANFRDAGYPIAIAVNISGALCNDPNFVKFAAKIAKQSSGGLIFEVTESAIMHDLEAALESFETWRQSGAKISIDDYGTGQSSLAYLKRIPADELKLDRAFVKDLHTQRRDRLLVKSTIDLAHHLGLKLTTEGIEDEETLKIVRLLGADHAQGYGLCRPVQSINLVGFLQRHDGVVPDSADRKAPHCPE